MPLNSFKISATVGYCDQWYYLFICTKVQAPIQGVTSLLLQKSRLITHTFGQKEAASSSYTLLAKATWLCFPEWKKDIPKQNRLHYFWSFAIFFGWNDLGTPIFPLLAKHFGISYTFPIITKWDDLEYVGENRCQRLFLNSLAAID